MSDNRMVVVGHYYPQREENLDLILTQLTNQGHRVLVWDNDPLHAWRRSLDHIPVDVLRCPGNPIHGRYLAALIYPEIDYFFFQDDDMLVYAPTIDRLYNAASVAPYRFVGIEGRFLDLTSPTPYTHAKHVRHPQPSHMLVRAYACHRSVLIHGLSWILKHGVSPGRCETMLMTWNGLLIPDTDWTNLPEYEAGLSYSPDHDREIDEFYLRYKHDLL